MLLDHYRKNLRAVVSSAAAQRAKDDAVRYAKAHDWDIRELKAPHDSMVTAPRELTALLIDMVAAPGSQLDA